MGKELKLSCILLEMRQRHSISEDLLRLYYVKRENYNKRRCGVAIHHKELELIIYLQRMQQIVIIMFQQ